MIIRRSNVWLGAAFALVAFAAPAFAGDTPSDDGATAVVAAEASTTAEVGAPAAEKAVSVSAARRTTRSTYRVATQAPVYLPRPCNYLGCRGYTIVGIGF